MSRRLALILRFVLSLLVMVSKFVMRFAFSLSVILLLMHNLTPHIHHSEMTEDQHMIHHEEASTLYDWLMLSFHDDLGSGHLECFYHLEIIALKPVWNFVIPPDLLFSNPFHFALTGYPDNEIILKHPFFRQSPMERICHEQDLFDRPPPTA